MTEQQIDRDRLRELVENATEGPWAADLDRYGETRGIWPTGPGEEQIVGSYVAADGYDSQGWTGGTDEDLSFIAAARQAVPALLDMLDQAEQRIRDLTQEARDERAACLDQIEQVQARDARIKAARDVHRHITVETRGAIEPEHRCLDCCLAWPCPTIRALEG